MKDEVMCPLVDAMIKTGDCVVYSDIARGLIKEQCLPEEFKNKTEWRNICCACKYNEM